METYIPGVGFLGFGAFFAAALRAPFTGAEALGVLDLGATVMAVGGGSEVRGSEDSDVGVVFETAKAREEVSWEVAVSPRTFVVLV